MKKLFFATTLMASCSVQFAYAAALRYLSPGYDNKISYVDPAVVLPVAPSASATWTVVPMTTAIFSVAPKGTSTWFVVNTAANGGLTVSPAPGATFMIVTQPSNLMTVAPLPSATWLDYIQGDITGSGVLAGITATTYFVSGTTATQHAGRALMTSNPAIRIPGTTASTTEAVMSMGFLAGGGTSAAVGGLTQANLFSGPSPFGVQNSTSLGVPYSASFPALSVNGAGKYMLAGGTTFSDGVASFTAPAIDVTGGGVMGRWTGTPTGSAKVNSAYVAEGGGDTSVSLYSFAIAVGDSGGSTITIEAGVRRVVAFLDPGISQTASTYVWWSNGSMASAQLGTDGAVRAGVDQVLLDNSTGAAAQTWFFCMPAGVPNGPTKVYLKKFRH